MAEHMACEEFDFVIPNGREESIPYTRFLATLEITKCELNIDGTSFAYKHFRSLVTI
jgi:hypothetical protein